MKNITNILLSIFCGIIILSSCEKMEDIHSDFLKDGDIIYAPKPLMPQSFGGKNRLKLKYYLMNAVNVNKCVVEWDEGNSSQTIDVTPKLPLDSLEIIIDGLEEKSYIFNIYTIDTNGNRSVKEQVTGSAYDAKFQSGLTNRPLASIVGGGTTDSIVVSWGTPAEGHTGLQMMYNNRAGEPVSRMVLPEDDAIVIRDWESEGEMTYQSYYVPEPLAIDTFAAENEQVTMPMYIEFRGTPVDKTNWTIVDFSSEEPAEAQWGPPIQGLAAAAIDNDPTTFWHSAWDLEVNPEHPHHITIDFGAVIKMNAFELTKRQGKNDCQKRFTVEVSLDNVNFTSLGTFTYEQASASQRYQTNSLPMARYLRYTAIEAYEDKFYTHLAEFSVEGVVAAQIDRSTWDVTDFSSEEPAEGDPNGRVIAALDGDLGTFWHTQWNGGSPDYPHYFVVDMKQQVKILAVECFRRQGDDRGQAKYKIHTSDDGVNFVDQGTFDFDNKIDAGQMASLAFMPEARYIKYEAIEGPNNFAFLAEFYVYGTTEP
ncbi:DUF4998 domain-containing protein [Sunxiuqinia dokdonensis]|uniref:F5/8 type C domain-containing protein n=1 Tax=Sunxiuqinia dokdonensis TaxID=1409788 RepID=A0A0L8V3T0_9BACT|nr:DUF4998 domain-containing protein [Sunxiuqinia dokdonensis]KOH43091.1 hypothetical protein NC99_40940 [Sunxiuqinia dokdonensis]